MHVRLLFVSFHQLLIQSRCLYGAEKHKLADEPDQAL